ncbi:DUF2511 domain-containing protein [Affinibrenneria salicis]|uniref:DUF2511 domain-containing protein n=1 Tax=Affinibrenneria salicis TaxID=2590031 RepID=A0A5J5G4B4_9GAMM|nr:YebY family protein [Affinibrenneria salicis]KAA9001695.1 DUF2511 domain-containing protein [Affinibrenneria salicis]
MKKRLLFLLTGAISFNVFSAAQLVTVSRLEYGQRWAFTREEMQLICRPGKALFALNTGTLAQYPLNDVAEKQMRAGQVRAQPIDSLLLDDPQRPGQKKSLQPFIERGQQLCEPGPAE